MSANAELVGIQEFVTRIGDAKFYWTFETIRCYKCEDTFIAFCDGRARFCPVCGTKLRFQKHLRRPDAKRYVLTAEEDCEP